MNASRILVATDLRPESDEAIRQAVLIAAKEHRVAVCHVLPDLRAVRPLFPQLNSDESLASVEAQGWAREALEACLTRLGNPDVDIFFETGVPHAKVLERAAQLDAAIIVIAASSDSERATGTAEGVVRGAKVPVLVVRQAPPNGPIVAATDMSDPSMSAFRLAARQAKVLGRDFVALHVVDVEAETSWLRLVKRLSDRGTEGYIQRVEALVGEASHQLAKLVVELAPGSRGEVRQGKAVEEICKRAKELGASIIVVATHGRTGIEGALVGSVAEGLVHAAPCSVLVVRHTG